MREPCNCACSTPRRLRSGGLQNGGGLVLTQSDVASQSGAMIELIIASPTLAAARMGHPASGCRILVLSSRGRLYNGGDRAKVKVSYGERNGHHQRCAPR
jgi:hypothetical protein